MRLAICIRFLTGRAHLHPWQTHHNEGRVEWPPSQWRLLRALVAVAGRGLTTLPTPDFILQPKPPGTRINRRRKSVEEEQPIVDLWQDQQDDLLKISQLMALLAELQKVPTIWLPKTAGGHTRQYFPIHQGGIVKNSGSAVFDTFATVRKDQPLVFHWPDVNLDPQSLADLKLILGRMTYFGRAESWCRADAHVGDMKDLPDVVTEGGGQSHWRCVCIEDAGKPHGKEYREFTLERRLAPVDDVTREVADLLPRTKVGGKMRENPEALRSILESEKKRPGASLLRCLLRESGEDIKDGLDRPIGSRWVHYAVPRAVFDVPRPRPQVRSRASKSVNLVVYALNTTTVHRPVLPPLTDTLRVADDFRSAIMALARHPGRAMSGHKMNGEPCRNHAHAFWWPTDDDQDGFLDHVTVYASGGFEQHEVDALRRLTRIRQRSGRPDLLVTPIYVGRDNEYVPWQPYRKEGDETIDQRTSVFVSATPYYCPVSLSRGRNSRASRPHSIKKDIRKRLQQQQLIDHDDVQIEEFVFDYAPSELREVQLAIANGEVHPPVPPRQFFPVIDPPAVYADLPKPVNPGVHTARYDGAAQKDPDEPFTFGLCSGLYVDGGSRFVRSLAFCRRRRYHEVRGPGRMFCLIFRNAKSRRPFAIGDQCHFGLGLFVPGDQKEGAMS